MSFIYRKMILCFLVIIIFGSTANSQDSLHTFPSAKKIETSVKASLEPHQNADVYHYSLTNKPTSEQKAFQFFIEIDVDVEDIKSPEMWSGEISKAKKKVVFWGSRGGSYDLSPSNTLRGFSFKSNELPSIVTYYGRGFFKSPQAPEGEAPPLDSVKGADIFENSVKGKTIGPKKLSDSIDTSALADTLQSYLNFSCDTIWISNQGICRSLEAKLENVDRQMDRGNTNAASGSLEAFLNEVEAQNDKQLSSEAYALLYFNGQYLLEQLNQ